MTIRRKRCMIMGVLTAFALSMTACGAKEDTSAEEAGNSISVAKNGAVESVIVEDFTQSYYSAEDLKSMILDTIDAYQKQSQEAEIALKTCEAADGKVKVVLEYNNAAAYSGYNSEALFVGTVKEAYDAGYALDMTLTGTDSEGTQISRKELLNMGDSHIFIMENVIKEGTLRVNCYDTILYTGGGVTPVAKKKADISPADGYSVIVFK